MASREPVILVVEDVALVRMNLALHLEEAGFKVFEAASAEGAIELLEEAGDPVDIVLTDLNMPGSKGGAGLLKWLAEHRPGVVRAICTAHAGMAPVGDVSAANLVFEKPFDPVRLSRDLWQALSR